jgi:hypothetical protein
MIFASADLHIGASLRKRDPEFRDDSYLALDLAADRLIEKAHGEPSALLLAGDVFDRDHISGEAILAFRTFVERLKEAGIQVWAIEGNHDRQPGGTPLAEALGGRLLSPTTTTDVLGLKVCGVSYQPPERLREMLPCVPSCDVLLLHAPMKALLGFETASGLLESEIPECAGLTVVGDIHRTRLLRTPAGAPIISPGPLHPCAMSEPFDTSMTVLNGRKGHWSFDQVPVALRAVERLDLTEFENADDVSDIVEAVVERLLKRTEGAEAKPVLHIKAPSGMEGEVARARRAAGAKAVVVETIGSKGSLSGMRPSASAVAESLTPAQALDMTVDAARDPEVHDLLSLLLTAPEPEAALEEWHKGLLERMSL